MKTKACLILLALPILALLSFDKPSLLNQRMPILPGKTLDDKPVDEHYYKGHLTLVSFMYIGCQPCMNEIAALNRLKKELAGNERFQILCIARQMRIQMLNFSARNKSQVSFIRRSAKLDSIQYDVLPACPDAMSKMDSVVKTVVNGNKMDTSINIRLNSECDVIEQLFGITAYPTIFLVDENGIIRKISNGGPIINNDAAFYKELKSEVDSMLQR